MQRFQCWDHPVLIKDLRNQTEISILKRRVTENLWGFSEANLYLLYGLVRDKWGLVAIQDKMLFTSEE